MFEGSQGQTELNTWTSFNRILNIPTIRCVAFRTLSTQFSALIKQVAPLTPEALEKCLDGRTDVQCTDYSQWTTAWSEIKG